MKLRNFIIGLILAIIIGAIVYDITNDRLVKSIKNIQEHNNRLEETINLLGP